MKRRAESARVIAKKIGVALKEESVGVTGR
jgi:hypothetical protein